MTLHRPFQIHMQYLEMEQYWGGQLLPDSKFTAEHLWGGLNDIH